jgi:hypothetical protein
MKQPKVDHVAPGAFNAYRWWAPQRLKPGPTWFYATLEHGYHRPGPVDLATVDAPLRRLVSDMQGKKIITLPSCAGHFPSDQDLWDLYQNLLRDAEWVRSYGLTLKCVETGELDVYRDPMWRLPSYGPWAEETKKYSGIGRIGLVLSPERAEHVREQLLDTEGVQTEIKSADDEEGHAIATLITRTNNLPQRDALWSTITARLKQV